MTVSGHSMWPFIRDGDVVEIARTPAVPVVGAVVLAQLADGRNPLHRIIAHKGDAWLLCGDNCGAPDGLVHRGNLVGVVEYVERNQRKVCLALGRTGQWIAWLHVRGWLLPLMRGLCLPQRVIRAILRSVRALPGFRA
jgi:hypothetical protein